ncbi:hypothetical protein L3081_25055 [Colwellia sp. MSW7]|uniref:ABC transporter permease n=1 Tax=Colwellia maritima TaxID=2912588 RepID=A0ABS9X7A1_9GAMM|nr:hypothetical protein [Colwellia maritima]MCI2286094.1 hypothetical protein [Colwellia maritima]
MEEHKIFTKMNIRYQKWCSNNTWRIIRAYLYLIVSVLSLIAAYQGWFYYGDDHASWFGRSGALVAIWATMSESLLLAYGFGSIFQGIGETNTIKFRQDNKWLIMACQSVLGFMIVLGTMTWAYGDIFYNLYLA